MSLQEEIKVILTSQEMSYEAKREKLLKIMTPSEVNALLPKPAEVVKLKQPYQENPNGAGTRNLNLSVVKPIFDSILNGNHLECRDYHQYIDRCTYVEGGVRYLVPFDTITFYVGKGKNARWAKSMVTNITCDGDLLYFHLGQVIDYRV